jgi:hypothetical protein
VEETFHFRGATIQKGHGLGSMFKSFYRWILPVVKTHALPLLKDGAQTVKNEALKTVANIANDTLKGKNISDAAKERAEEAVTSLVEKTINKREQSGSGLKKKKDAQIKSCRNDSKIFSTKNESSTQIIK